MTRVNEHHPPRHILVAGAGTMGHGLALLMAKAGHRVSLLDLDESILDRAMEQIKQHLDMLVQTRQIEAGEVKGILNRVGPVNRPDDMAEADLILESITEDIETKRRFYTRVAETSRPDALVASNTSYLNIFELAPDSLQHRLLICHFFAPPYLIPLVEIVKGPGTQTAAVEDARQLLLDAGQRPVVLDKFIPGFIVNRLQRAMGREIFHLIDTGVAAPETIDQAVLASLGIRLPVLGVVRRLDFAGLDFTLKALSNPSIELVSEDRPSQAVKDLVAQGRLGVKSGSGFYSYEKKGTALAYDRRDRLLIRMKQMMNRILTDLWQD